MNEKIKQLILASSVALNLTTVVSPALADSISYKKSDLVDFYTDGCTDAPQGIPGHPNEWLHCCYAHDKKYFAGGTFDEKKSADLTLAQCVEQASGSETIGSMFYFAVRVGGTPYRNTTYRWGYGWPYGRAYTALTTEERAWADEKIAGFNCLAGLNEFTFDSAELHRACGY